MAAAKAAAARVADLFIAVPLSSSLFDAFAEMVAALRGTATRGRARRATTGRAEAAAILEGARIVCILGGRRRRREKKETLERKENKLTEEVMKKIHSRSKTKKN